jgi:hypothetical protein
LPDRTGAGDDEARLRLPATRGKLFKRLKLVLNEETGMKITVYGPGTEVP